MEDRYIFIVKVLLMATCCTHLVLTDDTTTESLTSNHFHFCSPPVVRNARTTENRTSYLAGERAELVCKDGYRVPFTRLSVLHLVCTENGSWQNYVSETDIPTCERVGGCPKPNLPHMTIPDIEGDFMPGMTVPLSCHEGFVLGTHYWKSAIIVCHSDGTWQTGDGSTKMPTCIALTCKVPEEFPHGSIRIMLPGSMMLNQMQDNMVPDSTYIYYSCDPGYVLNRDVYPKMNLCVNGQWISSSPHCVKEVNYPGCHLPGEVNHTTLQTYPVGGSVIDGDLLPEGSHITYTCKPGYLPYKTQTSTLFCVDGRWIGSPPTCIAISKPCSAPPSILHGDFMLMGSSVNSEGPRYPDGAKVYYYCDNGYRPRNSSLSVLVCADGQWQGIVPLCERRKQCDKPMDIPNGNWLLSFYVHNYGIRTRIVYECLKGYKAIGTTHLECMPSGYWSDYAPRCLAANKYCNEPGPIENGMYMCRPSHCDLFKVGTEVHYVCNKDYVPREDDVMVQKCLAGGVWSDHKPVCQRTDLTAASDPLRFNTSTLTVVIATSCGVLGLLVIVMIIVVVQRRHKPRSSRLCHPSTPPPPPYPSPPTGLVDEPDRVALIAFADGIQVMLPSYEEAIRGRPGTRLTRYSSDNMRGSLRLGGGHADHRHLPSLPSSLRNAGQQLRDIPNDHHRDHHRNSVITTTSITTRDNLSLTLGSMDTVNISDGTSTSVTVETASSNPSIATSQRAAAGSIESSSTNGSLATDDAPLLDQSHYNSETMRSHHSNTSDTILSSTTRAPCTDRVGYDTLHSQGSRSQSESSPIVELPEEQKET